MKVTGIIRRVDDLGRVIIPKEIRERLRIQEGAPLEIFIEDEGVCFMKYQMYDDAEWKRAKKILTPLLDKFAILDCYGDCVADAGIKIQDEHEALRRKDLDVYPIMDTGDKLASLITPKNGDIEKIAIARRVLSQFLDED